MKSDFSLHAFLSSMCLDEIFSETLDDVFFEEKNILNVKNI